MRRRWIDTVVALATGTLVVLAAAYLTSGLSDFVLTAAPQLGGSSGNARVASEAAAETDQSAAELEAHFAAQLKTAGWQHQAGAVDGALAWSSWKLPRDGDWQGFLFVIQGPGARHRSLNVRAESVTQAQTGWTTSIKASSSSRVTTGPASGRSHLRR